MLFSVRFIFKSNAKGNVLWSCSSLHMSKEIGTVLGLSVPLIHLLQDPWQCGAKKPALLLDRFYMPSVPPTKSVCLSPPHPTRQTACPGVHLPPTRLCITLLVLLSLLPGPFSYGFHFPLAVDSIFSSYSHTKILCRLSSSLFVCLSIL